VLSNELIFCGNANLLRRICENLGPNVSGFLKWLKDSHLMYDEMYWHCFSSGMGVGVMVRMHVIDLG
jgi:hypothetical protein